MSNSSTAAASADRDIHEGRGERYSNGSAWGWFELSYSGYLVLPRTLMCGMPEDWQARMVALLDEAGEVYDGLKIEDNYHVTLRDSDGKFKKDPLAAYRHFNINNLPYSVPLK